MQLEMVKLKDWETQELGNLSDNLLRFVCFKICPCLQQEKKCGCGRFDAKAAGNISSDGLNSPTIPRKSKDRRESTTWIILKTILCLVGWTSRG